MSNSSTYLSNATSDAYTDTKTVVTIAASCIIGTGVVLELIFVFRLMYYSNLKGKIFNDARLTKREFKELFTQCHIKLATEAMEEDERVENERKQAFNNASDIEMSVRNYYGVSQAINTTAMVRPFDDNAAYVMSF